MQAEPITLDAIASRFRAIEVELDAACEPFHAKAAKERQSLRELCSGLGHDFSIRAWAIDFSTNSAARWVLCCRVCEEQIDEAQPHSAQLAAAGRPPFTARPVASPVVPAPAQ